MTYKCFHTHTHTHTHTCCECIVRDRVRTKMERDILAEMRHPFIVTLEYGETLCLIFEQFLNSNPVIQHFRQRVNYTWY